MDKHEPVIKSSYLGRYLDNSLLNEHIKLAVDALKKYADKFDAIAFTGMSGALVAPSVALTLGKTLIMVRKPGKRHSSRVIEGDYAARTYVFVDDLVDTGSTLRRIKRDIKNEMPFAKYVGTLEVNDLYKGGRNELTYLAESSTRKRKTS